MTNGSDQQPGSKAKSWLSARVEPFWVNPATIKGTVALAFGLFVLLAPGATLTVFRYGVGMALVLSGGSDVWFNRRRQAGSGRVTEGLLSMGIGLTLMLFPRLAFNVMALVVAGFLVVRGTIALLSTWRDRSGNTWAASLVRGVLFILLGIIVVFVPESLLGGIMISVATAAFILGGIMLGYGLQYRDEKDLVDIDSATVSQIVRRWADSRDIGEDKRETISTTLFFEPPNRLHKLMSWWVMLLLSVAIATFAVLQDSTAVVIGAMLIAPLMTPIMGAAAGIVYGWRARIVSSLALVAAGVSASIGLAFILAKWVPILVPLTVNSQVTSRVNPTLIDMLIALAAGAAGAYATVDDRVSASITGVAIAVALVPPLAVVGITLEAGLFDLAVGSFLLFATNLVSIILAGGIVLYLTGFAPFSRFVENRQEIRTTLGIVVLIGILILIPLVFTVRGILTTASNQASAQEIVEEWLGESTGLRLVKVNVDASQVKVLLTGAGTIPDVPTLENSLTEAFSTPTLLIVEYAPTVIVKYSEELGLVESSQP